MPTKKEIKLQSEVVTAFSQQFPEKRGQLFHVPNERNNLAQVFQARAIGIFPGVSDLIYLDEKGIVGIELKQPGTYHKVKHINQQIEWAKIIEGMGATWRLCRTVEESISCTLHDYQGLTISDVEEMVKNNGKKVTLKF